MYSNQNAGRTPNAIRTPNPMLEGFRRFISGGGQAAPVMPGRGMPSAMVGSAMNNMRGAMPNLPQNMPAATPRHNNIAAVPKLNMNRPLPDGVTVQPIDESTYKNLQGHTAPMPLQKAEPQAGHTAKALAAGSSAGGERLEANYPNTKELQNTQAEHVRPAPLMPNPKPGAVKERPIDKPGLFETGKHLDPRATAPMQSALTLNSSSAFGNPLGTPQAPASTGAPAPNPAEALPDFIFEIMQSAYNASGFYRHMAQLAPEHLREQFEDMAQNNERRAGAYQAQYMRESSIAGPITPSVPPEHLVFAQGVRLAVVEERKQINALADWFDAAVHTDVRHMLSSHMIRKVVDLQFLSSITV